MYTRADQLPKSPGSLPERIPCCEPLLAAALFGPQSGRWLRISLPRLRLAQGEEVLVLLVGAFVCRLQAIDEPTPQPTPVPPAPPGPPAQAAPRRKLVPPRLTLRLPQHADALAEKSPRRRYSR